MLELSRIREDKEAVVKGLLIKNHKTAAEDVEKAIDLDQKRKDAQTETDVVLAEANQKAKMIGGLMQQGKKEEAEKIKAESSELKAKAQELEANLKSISKDLIDLLVKIPNVPHISVPKGNSEDDNEIVKTKGEPTHNPNSKPHWEVIKESGEIDFELGNKITGAGFPVYIGAGAKRQRDLINLFIDSAVEKGYTEVQVPILVNEASAYATGQLPDKDGQMYHDVKDDLYLIPTGEVPITNIYRDTILKEEDLPIKHVGYTPCFRREAGSWGAHVRGLNRLHQFDKVEIVQISKPEDSYAILDEMCEHVESLLDKLDLVWRKLRLCGGDVSFTAAITYDYEVWSAAQDRWLEVSSVSNFETYQSNRLKVRYKTKDGKKKLAHTLNGSALALPRIVAALLEK